ncbi:MAG: DnaJ domain-containing protein [Thermodesulfobacteriota bacterium]
MDLKEALKLFELDENASEEEARQAYRDLISIWHPDKYYHNKRLHNKALEKTKAINEAYGILKKSKYNNKYKNNIAKENQNHRDECLFIRCSSCGTLNRVPPDKIFSAICGSCKASLGVFYNTYDSNFQRRVACGNGNCIGIIGVDGRCTLCGRTLEEGKRKASEGQCNQTENENDNSGHTKSGNWVFKKRNFIIIAAVLVLSLLIFLIQNDKAKENNHKTALPKPKSQGMAFIDKDTTNKTTIDSAKPPEKPLIVSRDALNSTVTEKIINNKQIDKLKIKIVQQSLSQMHYNIGSIDGKFGTKTRTALLDYLQDFANYIGDHRSLDIAMLLSSLMVNLQIYKQYPEWKHLAKNRTLGAWVSSKKGSKKLVYQRVLQSKNPKKIIYLISVYKFEHDKPPALPFPSSDLIFKNFKEGIAPLVIVTNDPDINHLIKVSNINNKEDVVCMFIQGAQRQKHLIPLGSYEIKYAAGKTWYGVRYLFGPDTIFGKADKIFDFKKTGNEVHGYQIRLYKVPHGNLRTKQISPFDF